MILVVPLSIPSLAENELRGLNPNECNEESLDPCTCYHGDALDKIALEIQFAETCRKNLERYKRFAEEAQKPVGTEWYQEPAFIVGGLILTFSTAGVIGYLLGRNQ
jgi:hypothetical protein